MGKSIPPCLTPFDSSETSRKVISTGTTRCLPYVTINNQAKRNIYVTLQ